MNARERRKDRRLVELAKAGRVAEKTAVRAVVAERELDGLQAQVEDLRRLLAEAYRERGMLEVEVERAGDRRVAEIAAKLAQVTNERDEALREARDLDLYAAERVVELRELRERHKETEEQVARLCAEVALLRAEDRDAAKLRRRLREAHEEVASLHDRVRRLEAGGEVEKLYGRSSTPGGPPRFGDGGGI